jgi:Domain of unknown function (DUF4201)
MADRAQAKDALIGKLQLKNAALKAHCAKIASRAAQEQDTSDALSAVDFEQLKIENAQFTTRLEARNAELLTIKTTTGQMVQVSVLHTSCPATPLWS